MIAEKIQVGQVYFCQIDLLIGSNEKKPFTGEVVVQSLSEGGGKTLYIVKNNEGALFYVDKESLSVVESQPIPARPVAGMFVTPVRDRLIGVAGPAYTRDRLIKICERAIVPVRKWSNRDSPMAHEQIGLCWALLKADCDFEVITKSKDPEDRCVTDENAIWLRVKWPNFMEGEGLNNQWFYLPTEQRLNSAKGRDWY